MNKTQKKVWREEQRKKKDSKKVLQRKYWKLLTTINHFVLL